MAIRAVGSVWNRSGEVEVGCEVPAGFDESVTVTMDVDPGAGEGGGVETTRLVTVNGGLLTRLDGNRLGETKLVSGGWEGEEMLSCEKGGWDVRDVGEGEDWTEDGVSGGGWEDDRLKLDGGTVESEPEGDGELLGEPVVDLKEGEKDGGSEELEKDGGSEELKKGVGPEELEKGVGSEELGKEVGFEKLGKDVGSEELENDLELEKLVGGVELDELEGDDELGKLVGDVELEELVGDVELEKLVGDVELEELVGDVGLGELVGDVELEKLDEEVELEELDDVELEELEDIELEELEDVELEELDEDVELEVLDDVEVSEGSLSETVLNGGEDIGVGLVDEGSWDVRLGTLDVDGGSWEGVVGGSCEVVGWGVDVEGG